MSGGPRTPLATGLPLTKVFQFAFAYTIDCSYFFNFLVFVKVFVFVSTYAHFCTFNSSKVHH